MLPGVYSDLTNEQYHGGPGVNKGLLDLVNSAPARALLALTSANDNSPTAALMLGTALHSLVLEPQDFAARYVRAISRSDAPDAVDERDALVAMVQELNADRLPKLSTSGAKTELIERILESQSDLPECLRDTADGLSTLKLSELKGVIERANESRPGLLPTTGTRQELAAILRQHGRQVVLWSEVQAEFQRANEGREVLNPDDWAQLHAMRDAVMAHPAARALLTEGQGFAELSVYWTDPATGELCRCRPDWWRADGCLVDLKSTEDASREGFSRSVVKWRYHVQAPWYLDGTAQAHSAGHAPAGFARPTSFKFIAVEKKAPHLVAVYDLEPESMELGRAEYRDNLDTLVECKRTGVWPGYGDEVQPLGVPAWYLKRAANDNDELDISYV